MPKNTKKLTVVVGLGKTGMSVIRFLSASKKNLAVIDSRNNPPGFDELKRNYPDLPCHFGDFKAKFLKNTYELIISPGVSPKEPALQLAINQGAKISGDIELFAKKARAPVVAITGANGKSTVTSLVGAMAKNAKLKVKVGGNLGTPALDLLDPSTDLYVLELSSFQLETTSSLTPATATVLNISPDHMDRYEDLNDYIKTKQKIYRKCHLAVINRDDPISYEQAPLPKKILSFGLSKPIASNFGIDNNYLVQGKKKLIRISQLKIKGMHQVANALAALALGSAVNIPLTAMIKTLRTFRGLPHRCQLVATINRIGWYNDSKATNVGATKAALEGLGSTIKGKIVLIAGGLGKDADFTPLNATVAKYVKTLVLIGHDAKIIAHDLNSAPKILFAKSIKQAIKLCYNAAKSHDAVLLAPACASFDMFNNFEHRGEVFTEEVKKLKVLVKKKNNNLRKQEKVNVVNFRN